MSGTIKGAFATRREADMAVERLVQEHSFERSDIFVSAVGADNTAGADKAGSDTEAGQPSPEERDDAHLAGAVEVSVDVNDDALAEKVRAAFAEFGAD